MKGTLAGGLCGGLLLLFTGCSGEGPATVETPRFEVQLFTVTDEGTTNPITSARVKVVEATRLVNPLLTKISSADLSDGIPEAQYEEFFQALPAVPGFPEASTDAAGTVVLARQPSRHLVVALGTNRWSTTGGFSFWMVAGSKFRDGTLILGDHNEGSGRGLDTLAAQPGFRKAFSKPFHKWKDRVLAAGDFDKARALVRNASKFLAPAAAEKTINEIDRQEAHMLRGVARATLANKQYDKARQLARKSGSLADKDKADALLAAIERAQITELQDKISQQAEVLHHQAEKALEEGDLDKVRLLLRQADLVSPDHEKTKALRAKLAELPGTKPQEQGVRVFRGHEASVSDIAFSPDGRLVVSGGVDKTVRFWEVKSGRETRVCQGHTAWVSDVAVSGDSRFAVSGSDDNTIRVWDVANGEETRKLDHGWLVSGIALSRDGRKLLSGSSDKTVKLWSLEDGELVHRFEHGRAVTCVAFSPDDRFAVSGSEDGSIKMWDVHGFQLVRTYQEGKERVTSVAFSPDGRFLLSGGDNQRATLWESGSARQVRSFAGHKGWVTSVAFSPDGQRVVSGSLDGTVRVWETTSGTEISSFTHGNPVSSVAFHPDGGSVMSGGEDNALKLWEFPPKRGKE